MKFQILNSINPQTIANSARSLNDEMIEDLSVITRPNIHLLKPTQFLFLMANLASRNNNFSKNLELIDRYLEKVNELNLKLTIENTLYALFLKRYESEVEYHKFFEVISQHYPKNVSPKQIPNRVTSLAFFVHTPAFLAHTNPLFTLLKTKQKIAPEITVLSLAYNRQFEKACQEHGANFIVLSSDSLLGSYEKLIKFSSKFEALVWLCLPVHLTFIANQIPNTVWWSHKFHPGIKNIAKRIGAEPKHHSTFTHFGYEWRGFDTGFEVLNDNASLSPWSVRVNNFASICREELIDNESHWKMVSEILRKFPTLTYNYTGRQSIHNDWCEKFAIAKSKINFMGWLAQPDQAIRNQAFLLDGPKLGHGLMALSALSCGVPIISPSSCQGAFSNFLARNLQTLELLDERKLIQQLVFESQQRGLSAISDVLNKYCNIQLTETLRKLWAIEKTKYQNFSDFLSIITSD